MGQVCRLGAVLILLSVTAGCSTQNSDDAAGGTTIENCGARVSVAAPPERAVLLDQETTETLLALGLGDHIIGTALQVGPVAEKYRAEYAKIPMLNSKELTGEQLRAADPDFAATSVTTDFTRERVGTRAELATLGVPTYVSSASCPTYQPNDTPFDRLFTDYANFGTIFGVPARATALIDEQRAVIADAEKAGAARKSTPTVAFVYSVYNGAPYVAGGSGLPANMSRILGLTNVFDDVDQNWPEVSWEQIAARKPSIIVLADLPDRGEQGDSADDKIQLMRAHPVLSQLDAVRDGRFVTVPGLELDPTVRSVNALTLINDGLAALG